MTLVERDLAPDLSSLSLDELAATASREHHLVVSSVDEATAHMTKALIHAVRAGEAFLMVKQRVGADNWASWLEANVDYTSKNQVSKYCRWAYHKEVLVNAPVPLSTATAMDYLKGLPQVPWGRNGGGQRTPEESVDEMRRLHAMGTPIKEIAELVGVHKSTVAGHLGTSRWTPEKRARRAKLARAKAKAQRQALERQELAKTAKKVGGRTDKAYSLIRQACAEIDGAMAELEYGRDDLRLALSAAHKAEDHISAAIRKAA